MTGSAPAPRAAVYTLGCRLNQAESAVIEAQLRSAGYAVVPWGAPCDVAVVNTCTVTGEADAKSRQALRRVIRENPGAVVAAVGCYAQNDAEALGGIEGVDYVVGNARKLDFLRDAVLTPRAKPELVCGTLSAAPFRQTWAGAGEGRVRANLKIQDGCDCRCAYCSVWMARGPARSREFADLLGEAQACVSAGVKELVLTGVNAGCYGYEGRGLLDVVDALSELPALARLRVSSIELPAIPDGLFSRMARPDHALQPFLHVPLQSGSDAILKAMGRRYRRAEWLGAVTRAAAEVKGCGIGTDVMVGFPGETRACFEETLALLREAPLANLHVFKYSPRPGTPAAQMPQRVAPPVINERAALVRALGREKRRAFYQAQLGRTAAVLFEERADGLWYGYTGNYVYVGARSPGDLKNRVQTVALVREKTDYLEGELYDRPPETA